MAIEVPPCGSPQAIRHCSGGNARLFFLNAHILSKFCSAGKKISACQCRNFCMPAAELDRSKLFPFENLMNILSSRACSAVPAMRFWRLIETPMCGREEWP
jgi:hypothetical protein